MHEIILCKLGEIVLKGLNRHSFEMKLMSNIRRRTQRYGKFKIPSRQSTIYVEPVEETCDLNAAYDACKKVFGIIAIARAVPCAKEKEAIFATANDCLGIPVTSIFDPSNLPDYASFDSRDCPMCKAGQPVDAIMNGYGYSKL